MASRYQSYINPIFHSLLPKAKQWFEAARNGDEKALAEILSESTEYLWETETMSQQIAFHVAVENGHENIVTQLLAVDPSFIDAVDTEGQIALHIAASKGHDKVLELLLAAKPSSATKTIEASGQTALHCAARGGHNQAVDKLLAACPALIDVVAFEGRTVLHEAAASYKQCGTIVTRLLAEKPSLIGVTDEKGNLALHFAALAGCSHTVAELMAALPGSASATNKALHIPLHFAATHQSEQLITQLLRANPEGAFALDEAKRTPFQIAVECHNEVMVDMLQQHFSYDELTDMFTDIEDVWVDQLAHLQREMVVLCGPALQDALYPDVMNTVYEYIGLTGNADKHLGRDFGSRSGFDIRGFVRRMKINSIRKGLAQGSIDADPPRAQATNESHRVPLPVSIRLPLFSGSA